MGKSNDLHGWVSGLYRVSVCCLRVRENILTCRSLGSLTRYWIPYCYCRVKTVLYALVRRFEFSLTLPAKDVTWSNIPPIRKAYIKGREDKGPHMPLRIKPYVGA